MNEVLNRAGNNIFALFIIVAFFLIVYTMVKKQSIADTFEQISEVFNKLFGGDDDG